MAGRGHRAWESQSQQRLPGLHHDIPTAPLHAQLSPKVWEQRPNSALLLLRGEEKRECTGRRKTVKNIHHGHSYDPKRNSTSAFRHKTSINEKIKIIHTLPPKHSQHSSHLKIYNEQKRCPKKSKTKEIFVNRHSPWSFKTPSCCSHTTSSDSKPCTS